MAPIHARNCPYCETRADENFIECCNCTRKIHFQCIDMPKESFGEVRVYYCSFCESNSGFNSKWKKRQLTSAEYQDKRANHYEVDRILSHNVGQNRRKFLIRWEYFEPKDYTWEIGENLACSIDILQSYCVTNNLELSKIKGKVGGIGVGDNINYVEVNKIMERIDIYTGWPKKVRHGHLHP